MYFPLEINQQLANAMRAVAEAKAEIGIFKAQEEKNGTKRVSMESVDELDEVLCDAVCRIAGLAGSTMSACAIDESDKVIKNRLNLESCISE